MQFEQSGTSTKMPEPDPKYTYHIDTPDTPRKGVPEAWTTTDKVNEKMYGSYPVYSHIPGTRDEEPIRFGPFVLDIDTKEQACRDAQVVISHFDSVYGLEPDQWHIYLSGKKGNHLELPPETMGLEGGHHLLPLIYKRLALDVQSATGVKLDMSMYNMGTGKPYRQPNVRRQDTGTYKVPVDLDGLSLAAADPEEYALLVSQPRENVNRPSPEMCAALTEKIAAYTVEAEKAWHHIKNETPLTAEERERLRIEMPPCVKYMRKVTSGDATFNEVSMAVTAYYISTGIEESIFTNDCQRFIENYPSTSLTTLDKRYQNSSNRYRSMLANGYSFKCGPVLALKFPGSAFECSECPHYKNERNSAGSSTDETNSQGEQTKKPISPAELLEEFSVKDDYVKGLGKEEFIFPNLLIKQHVVTIIAMSGAGKTTFNYFHVAPELAMNGLTVWYIDADSPASDHRRMKETADRYGFKFLNPDANEGTSIEKLIGYLKKIADAHTDLTDNVFFFDTLKKMVDLMSKGSVKEFYKLARKLASLGATVVLLGHANKYRDRDGNLVFEGVGDVRSDSDELIQLQAVKSNFDGIDVTTIVDPDKGAKVRGVFKPFSFNISSSREVTSYEKPLDLVDYSATATPKATDTEILDTAEEYLHSRGEPVSQHQLVNHTSDMTAAGAGRVRRLIVQNSSAKDADQIDGKRFAYTIGKNNSHMYEMPELQRKPVEQPLFGEI